jgi:NAD(P)-dependent dehydrogenase (short-subunit alcohol dehydrogenase family)
VKLDGGAAVVTGGASGLGWATAVKLADRGMRVTVLDLNDPAEQGNVHNGIAFVHTDVTDDEQVEAGIDQAASEHPLRVAVACAGIGASMRTVSRDGRAHSRRLWNKVMSVNLLGTFHTMTRAAAKMSTAPPADHDGQHGVIVTTASIAAFDGQIGQLAYAASKSAIVGMTLPAARDLGPAGVRVVCIAPGSMETPLMAQLTDEQRKGLVADAAHPRRLGDPEEFAGLVSHIAENNYLNGTVVRLDAGLRMPPK